MRVRVIQAGSYWTPDGVLTTAAPGDVLEVVGGWYGAGLIEMGQVAWIELGAEAGPAAGPAENQAAAGPTARPQRQARERKAA